MDDPKKVVDTHRFEIIQEEYKPLPKQDVSQNANPTSYEFVTFADMQGMRDAPAKSQIRKHAMKDIGVARRRPRKRRSGLELPLRPLASLERSSSQTSTASDVAPSAVDRVRFKSTSSQSAASSDEISVWVPIDHMPFLDDKAFFDPCIRSLSNRLDPFNSASVKIDSTIRGLLEYFVYYSSTFPNTWTYCPSALHHAPSGPKIEVRPVVDAALEDELMMKCILSAASSRMYHVDGVMLDRWRNAEVSSTQEALKLLQERINDEAPQTPTSTERLVSSVLHLGGAAFYRSDLETARVHSNAAVNIAELKGGVTGLTEPFIQGRLLSLDDLLSCVKLEPCVAQDTYDPGPVSALPCRGRGLKPVENEELAATGLLNDTVLLPQDLSELILQIRECYTIQLRLAQTTESDGVSMLQRLTISHWLTIRSLAIRNRLLAFQTSDTRVRALVVALIMWTQLPRGGNIKAYAKIVQSMAPKLKSVLDQTSAIDWQNHDEGRLWCLLVGYYCAPEASETQTWFAEELYHATRRCGIMAGTEQSVSKVLDELVSFQKRFFYHEPLLRPVSKTLAEWLVWKTAFPTA